MSPPTAVARHAILDRDRAIFGYELAAHGGEEAAPQRDAELLAHALSLADHQVLAARRVLMVGCCAETVMAGQLDLVDPERVVIEVALPRQAGRDEIAACAQALKALRERGLRLAFQHDVLGSAWQGWLAQARYLKLDIGRIPEAAFAAIVGTARRTPGLQLIAVGIATAAQHQQALAQGISLFQGPYFSQPVITKGQPMRPNQAVILDLIALLRRNAETAEIETLLKRDAALSFNLLRFINTSGLGLSAEITSFRHAVLILGLQKLLRWACLLMAGSRDGASSVGQTAVVRGRLMELLAAELMAPDECDHAFVVGVFSLLDAMTGVPLPEALEGLSLPEPVLGALLRRDGAFAPFLELTEACEAANEEAFAKAATRLQLSSHQVNMAHLQALCWAEELLSA